MTRKPSAPAYMSSVVVFLLAASTLLVEPPALAQQTQLPGNRSSAAQSLDLSAQPSSTETPTVPRTPTRFQQGKSNRFIAGASDDPLFQPAVIYQSGGYWGLAVAIGDMNGDGIPDLGMANDCSAYLCGNGIVGVLLGNGDGTFQPAVDYDTGGEWAASVAVADVNGDGKLDLIVANEHSANSGGPGTVAVLLGNGDGTFQPASLFALTEGRIVWADSVAVADVNGDGKPDLLLSLYGAKVNVLLGNGDGTFQPAVAYGLGCCGESSLAVEDVNGDGIPDLVFAHYGNVYSGWVAVLLGNGDGTFQPTVDYDSGGIAAMAVAIADVNGDGDPDLLVANEASALDHGSVPSGPGSVSVLFGNGDGTFQPAVVYPSGGPNYHSVAVADVDGDGKLDLLLASCSGTVAWYCGNGGDGSLGVLLGNGDGTFQRALFFDSGSIGAVSIAVADLNHDGKPDVALANWMYSNRNGTVGSVSVLLNNTSSRISTTASLLSLNDPSIYAQVVTFTVTVTSNSGTPIGTVQILNGSTVVGSGTLVSGSVSIPVSTLPAGSDSITASYLGGSGFAPSKSAPFTQTVTAATTTTSLISSLNPAGTNQAVTFTAKVASQYGGAASGTVAFVAGSQNLGSASLTGNVATLTTSFATAGTYSITAQYAGDSNNTGSISATLSEKIITSTTTALVSSLNPSVVGQAVTFTATVSSGAGAPPNGETITFKNGSAVLGTAPLSGGTASMTTSSLPAGAFTITASYPGDSSFAASTSPGLRQVVNSTTKSATSTTLASSLNPSIYGQKITWTATVTTIGPVPPTGTVSFNWSDGFRTFNIGSATLNSSGVAVLTRSNLNADPYPLTAKYQGDVNNLASTSPILNQTVLQATSAATITSLPNPSSLGQAVTFTAKITSPTVSPTGPVTFTMGKTVLASVQLSGGKATFTTSSLPLGSSVVTVTFNGSSNIKKSSASVTQVVQQ